jgi:hypothetical protein
VTSAPLLIFATFALFIAVFALLRLRAENEALRDELEDADSKASASAAAPIHPLEELGKGNPVE